MDIKKNITSIFLVPTLKIPLNALKDNNFINGYIKDTNQDTIYTDCVFLLFKPTNVDKFREFLDSEYERTQDIVEDYDYPKGYIVVVYQLNKKFTEDFKLIKKGKYSLTSKLFQNEFPKAVKIMKNGLRRDEISLQVRIFKKTPDLKEFWEEKLNITFDKEQEVWEGWTENNEILTKEKLIKYGK